MVTPFNFSIKLFNYASFLKFKVKIASSILIDQFLFILDGFKGY